MIPLSIPVRTFLAKVEEIALEEPTYRLGGSARDGTCDCIGLLIGAILRAGGRWTGTHGTNYAARRETRSLNRIASAADLSVGEAVFKAREPDDPAYDGAMIASRYAASADKRDYYHVGVVERVHPLRIRHMTTPKPKLDTKLGKWAWHGWLKEIEDERSENMQGAAVVTTENQKGVNVRERPTTAGKLIDHLPEGFEVTVIQDDGNWATVEYRKPGFIMSRFLKQKGED